MRFRVPLRSNQDRRTGAIVAGRCFSKGNCDVTSQKFLNTLPRSRSRRRLLRQRSDSSWLLRLFCARNLYHNRIRRGGFTNQPSLIPESLSTKLHLSPVAAVFSVTTPGPMVGPGRRSFPQRVSRLPEITRKVHFYPDVVDIHSHILPGLDDGSPSFNVSLNMAHIALHAGTTDIVATPHANTSYRFDPGVIAAHIMELQKAVGNVIKIHRGCDFHLSPENIEFASRDPARFVINGLNYLLVEFPEMTLFQGIGHIFRDLTDVGLTPLVSNPKRNRHLIADIPRLRRWVAHGIPLQITAQSLLSKFGAGGRSCLRLLEEGLAHFVASDAHELVHRTPPLDAS